MGACLQVDSLHVRVEGRLPDWLQGSFYRNGPGNGGIDPGEGGRFSGPATLCSPHCATRAPLPRRQVWRRPLGAGRLRHDCAVQVRQLSCERAEAHGLPRPTAPCKPPLSLRPRAQARRPQQRGGALPPIPGEPILQGGPGNRCRHARSPGGMWRSVLSSSPLSVPLTHAPLPPALPALSQAPFAGRWPTRQEGAPSERWRGWPMRAAWVRGLGWACAAVGGSGCRCCHLPPACIPSGLTPSLTAGALANPCCMQSWGRCSTGVLATMPSSPSFPRRACCWASPRGASTGRPSPSIFLSVHPVVTPSHSCPLLQGNELIARTEATMGTYRVHPGKGSAQRGAAAFVCLESRAGRQPAAAAWPILPRPPARPNTRDPRDAGACAVQRRPAREREHGPPAPPSLRRLCGAVCRLCAHLGPRHRAAGGCLQPGWLRL